MKSWQMIISQIEMPWDSFGLLDLDKMLCSFRCLCQDRHTDHFAISTVRLFYLPMIRKCRWVEPEQWNRRGRWFVPASAACRPEVRCRCPPPMLLLRHPVAIQPATAPIIGGSRSVARSKVANVTAKRNSSSSSNNIIIIISSSSSSIRRKLKFTDVSSRRKEKHPTAAATTAGITKSGSERKPPIPTNRSVRKRRRDPDAKSSRQKWHRRNSASIVLSTGARGPSATASAPNSTIHSQVKLIVFISCVLHWRTGRMGWDGMRWDGIACVHPLIAIEM